MRNRKFAFAFGALMAACLLVAACGADQVITNAETAIDLAEAALPAVSAAAGIPASTETAIMDYLTAAASGLSQASAVMAAGGSAGVDAADITAIFAKVTAPDLPSGTPQNVAAAVQAVSTALGQFLGQFATTTAAVPAGGSELFGHQHKLAKVKLSAKQKARVAAVKARADALLKKLGAK